MWRSDARFVFGGEQMEGIVSKGLKTKFAPYFFEVHTGCILYDRIHFKVQNGGLSFDVKQNVGLRHRVRNRAQSLFAEGSTP